MEIFVQAWHILKQHSIKIVIILIIIQYSLSLLEFTVYGAALIEHCLIEEGFPGNVKTGAGFDIDHGTATSPLIYNYFTICDIYWLI